MSHDVPEGHPSSSFHPPVEKTKVKVNLYDPHVAPEEKVEPGPADYFVPKKKQPDENESDSTDSDYAIINDGFGVHVQKKKAKPKTAGTYLPGDISYKSK